MTWIVWIRKCKDVYKEFLMKEVKYVRHFDATSDSDHCKHKDTLAQEFRTFLRNKSGNYCPALPDH